MKLLMNCLLFGVLLIAGAGRINAQPLEFADDKVKWSFSVEQNGCEAVIVARVKIVPQWHINAIFLPANSFGYATRFTVNKAPEYKLSGKVSEPKPFQEHDELADENLYYHQGTVTFRQKIRVTSKKDFVLKGGYTYQPCDENICLPPGDGKFQLEIKGCSGDVPAAAASEDGANKETVVSAGEDDQGKDQTVAKEIRTQEKRSEKSSSLLTIFVLSFLSGFAALLTPCVFPMIPMTVSFFTKQSKTRAQGIRNALIYGFSIIIIYIALGTGVTYVFGADALNNMSTSPTFNSVFFLILIVFAVSFMGAFEIRLPSSWINKADSASDRGGLIGIFFMALVLALVSFSCTGPIVGTLLVQAATEGGVAPFVGMFGFSLALALPFMLFAAFPGWLNSLPKSGGWLNTVKVVLGFLELALAFKFLSNADLALQAHYLERELFLAIWIAIFLTLTLYLFGKLVLPHDSPSAPISVGRTLLGITTLMFVIYMIPGLWGAPLKLISAFPPPLNYSESPLGFGRSVITADTGKEHIEGTHLGPQNIMVFHDFDTARSYAEKAGKPLFVDFTGHNCVNCRKMEQSVWDKPGIIDILRNDVVIASLHVDERVELPVSEQITVELTPGRMKTLKTTGDKWMYKQIKDYKVTAQPYYVMIGPDGETLANGSADYEHHSNPADFKSWLEKGIELYNRKK